MFENFTDKLNMQTTNIVDENIKCIGVLFPNWQAKSKPLRRKPQ